MKSSVILLFLTLLLSMLTWGCGYGSNYNAMNGAVPKITQLTPQNVIASSGTFILTIEGAGFTSGSVVYWNTTALPATVDSSTQLTSVISAAMVANAGVVSIYVHTTRGNSNTMMFNVD
jgi:predicted RecA/RadA family phage recombinase